MHHLSKGFWDMVEAARQKGCEVTFRDNKVFVKAPPPKKSMYTAHATERALHPLRRWIAREVT